jgi:branched-chain amino acid transport system substrate-binding protein
MEMRMKGRHRHFEAPKRKIPILSIFLIIFVSIIGAGGHSQTAMGFETEVGVTEDTIKIGTFAPFSGRAALYGKIDHSVQIVYRYINEEGGIHGRKLEIITEDTGCDPKGAIAAVKKLIHEDKVFMLHGGNCSNAVLAAKEEIVKSGIPYMIQGATLGALTKPVVKNIFTTILTSDEIADAVVDFVLSKPNVKRIAIVKTKDPWGMAMYEPGMKKLKNRGLTPVVDLDIAAGTTDATSLLFQIKKADPEVIILFAYPAETTVFMKGMNKLGLDYFCAGRATSPLEIYERTGSWDVAKHYASESGFRVNFDHPEFLKWTYLLNKYYPKDKVENLAFLCTAGAQVVVEALKRAGRDLTREKFIDALNNIRDFETGITHPISISPSDHRGLKKGSLAIAVKVDNVVTQPLVSDWNQLVRLRPEYK